MKSENHVYQFKITLKDIEPKIWRRIQVPELYTFWDLHVALQDAMGWTDCHLHQFELMSSLGKRRILIGIPDPECEGPSETLPGWEEKISKWFGADRKQMSYTYDFGDDWQHSIVLEKVLPLEKGKRYPVCIAGARACPPEDCGSVPGYEELCKAMKDPGHPRREELVEWLGGEYDPERFDPSEVEFDDPRKRLKMMRESC